MSDPSDKGGRAALGLFLAAGTVISAFILARAGHEFASRGDSLQIKGYAEEVVQADLGKWTGQFTARAATLPDAYAQLETARRKVLALLAAKGYAEDQVSLSSVDTQTLYKRLPQGGISDEITGYQLAQTVNLKDGNVARLDDLAREVTALIKDGVAIASFPPQYYFTGLESLKLDLLSRATKNAYERAAALAEASGSRVGALRNARQGVFQVTAYPSTDTSDYGIYDTSSMEKAVKAVVTVEFAID